jgi:hypothetical protein
MGGAKQNPSVAAGVGEHRSEAGAAGVLAMNFVVVPIGRNPRFGFWLKAADADEARKLVSLNVPEMAGVTDPDLAQCNPDQTYSPMHGLIFEGSGRSYTITRRRSKSPGGAVVL